MKKLLSFILALTASLMVSATVVTFDFTNPASLGITPNPTKSQGKDLSGTPLTLNGVTITFAKFNKGNDSKEFTKSDGKSYELRTYTSNTLTFTASENITGIECTGDQINFSEATNGVWTGSAKSVTLTATGTCKITTITVTIGEQAQVWTPDTISVTEAIRLLGAGDKHSHYIKGIVAGAPWQAYGKENEWPSTISFNMIESSTSTDTIQAFNMGNGAAGVKFQSLEEAEAEVPAGDTVLVYASGLAYYTPKNTTLNIPEINGGYFVEVCGSNVNRQNITLTSGTAVYENEESLISFTFSDGEGLTLALSDADRADGKAIAGTYNVTDFFSASIGNEALTEGRLLIKVNTVSEAGITYDVTFTSNNYKCTGTNLNLGDFPGDNNNITCAKAVEIGSALPDNGVTTTTYNIYGYYAKFTGKYGWSTKYPNQTFWMTDEKGSTYGSFECYQATVENCSSEADTLRPGDLVCLTATIKKYVGDKGKATYENDKGAVVRKVASIPEGVLDVTPTLVTVEEALAIGNSLTSGAKTPNVYQVRGYIVKIDAQKENTFFMSDNATDTYGDFQAYKCSSVYSNPKVGDYVDLIGNIERYDGTSSSGESFTNIEISGGKLKLVSQTPVENTVIKAEAVKTIENGQIVIIRNNVHYNVMGNVIR